MAREFYKHVFQGILKWAKENPKTEQVNELLLATDNEGRTVFHVAVELCKPEQLQEILNLVRCNLKREELKNCF
jgi:hypothetical protein